MIRLKWDHIYAVKISSLLSIYAVKIRAMKTTKTRTRKAHGYSVYKRKDGRWGWAVTTGTNPKGNPERVQGICSTETLAKDKALDVLAKHKAGKHIPTGRDKTLGQYLTEWIELYIKPHREPKTTAYYEGMIKNHIEPTLGRVPLRKLTSAQVQRMLNDKAKPFMVTPKPKTEDDKPEPIEKRLSAETLRGIKATLRSALSRAYKDGLVGENVGGRVETPKAPHREAEYLTAEDAGKLLAKAGDHPIDRLVVVALQTGMRIGEVTGLTWQDIDFENETVKIRGQLQRIEKKLTLKRLKSDRAARTLCLTKTALTALQDQKAVQVMQGTDRLDTEPYNPMNLVFLNLEGRPLDPKFVNDHLKAMMVKAKVKVLSFHKLRHTAATLMLAAGIPLTQVRDQLGHSQIALTSNIYGHAVPAALRTAAETLERVMMPRKADSP